MAYTSSNIKAQLGDTLQLIENFRLEALEKKRKATTTCFMIFGGALLIGVIVAAVANAGPVPLIAAVGLGLVVSFIVYSSIAGKAIAEFNTLYKEQIITKVAKALQPDMNYYPHHGMSKDVFRATGHYRTGIDRYKSEDLFQGAIGATEISFSELHAEYKRTSTDSKGNTKTSYHTIFKGVLFIADFHKDFNTWVTVYPDNETDGFFGWIGQKMQSLGGNLVKLENPTFEKHFVVKSPDDTTARYILTPAMQERLLDLRSTLGGTMKISFQQSSVNITVTKRENWYEPDITVPVTSDNQLNELASQMNFFFQIVEMLDLNTRIWTKE